MVAAEIRVVPDLFSDAPAGLQSVLQIALLMVAFLSGWIVLNTRRAMNWMARMGPPWWLGRTAMRLAEKPGWVWFYRIDCAVLFVGAVLYLVTRWWSH